MASQTMLAGMKFSITGTPNSHDKENDICYECPPGGVCRDKAAVADVNYWGFVDQGKLNFVLCSIGHCCQAAPCSSYDTCNEGHVGRLCTSCRDGYRLSLVNDDCVVEGKCLDGGILVVIIVTGIVYIAILLVKVELLNILQLVYLKIYMCYKRRNERRMTDQLQKCKDMASKGSVAEQSGETEDSDLASAMKGYSPPPKIKSDTIATESSAILWQIPFDSVEIFHIIVFHLQDTRLFEIRFPAMPTSVFSIGDYKDRIVSLLRLESFSFANQYACLPKEMTQVSKLFIKISAIPFMITMFFVFVFLIKISRLESQKTNRLMSSAYKVFLLIVLLSSQQLSTSSLNLINCVSLGSSGKYLRVDTTVECYQRWQWITYAYASFFIFPFWLTLFVGPGVLRFGLISLRTFLIGLLFPGPFLIYISVILYKNRKRVISGFSHNIMTDAILDEVWYSYKPLFGYRFLCWGGLVELRRLALVVLATLIPQPFVKVLCMILVTSVAFFAHLKFHPYLDRTANACANVSLCATMIVGILNFGWATLLYSGSGLNYGIAQEIAQSLATVEMCLIQIVPLGVILFCCVQSLWVNLFGGGKYRLHKLKLST